MEQPEPLDVGEDEVEAMSICFEDSLDLEERHENRITLVCSYCRPGASSIGG